MTAVAAGEGTTPRWSELPLTARITLRGCTRIRPLLAALGVDERPFLALLEAKYLIDTRPSREEVTAGGFGLRSGMITLIYVMSAHLGVGLAVAVFMISDPFWMMAITQSVVLFITGFLLATSFSSVFFATEDLDVLASLPVPGRTFLAVRWVHSSSYLLFVLLLLLGPMLVTGCFVYPLWAWLPLLLGSSLLTLGQCAGVIFVLCLVCVRMLPAGRRRDGAVYAMVAIMAAIQGLPLLFTIFSQRLGVGWSPPAWLSAVLPPAQYGSAFRLVVGEGATGDVVRAISGLLAPALLIVVARLLSGADLLRSLQSSESARPPARKKRTGWLRRLAPRVTRNRMERAGFEFFPAVHWGERRVKLLWLQMGVMLLPSAGLFYLSFEFASMVPSLLLVLLVSTYAGALEQQIYSDDYRAGEIFAGLSDRQRWSFVLGAQKALLLAGIALPCVLVPVLALAFRRVDAVLAAVISGCLVISTALLLSVRYLERIPFTERPIEIAGMGSAPMLVGCFLMPAFVGLLGLLYLVPYGFEAFLPVAIGLALWSFMRFRRGAYERPEGVS